MNKTVKLLDYQDNEKTFIIKNFENVKEFVFQILSGDGILEVVYNDNHAETFDSSNDRVLDFYDGMWFIRPTDIDVLNRMKSNHDTDELNKLDGIL